MQQPPFPYQDPINVIPPPPHGKLWHWYHHRPPALQIAIVCVIVIALLFLGVFCASITLASGHGPLPTPITAP